MQLWLDDEGSRVTIDASFEWDEAKAAANLRKHGVDFVRAARIFDGRPVFEALNGRDTEASSA